jgi:hypothetical protein
MSEQPNPKKETPKLKTPPILLKKTQKIFSEITPLLGGPLIAYWNNPRGSLYNNDVVY